MVAAHAYDFCFGCPPTHQCSMNLNNIYLCDNEGISFTTSFFIDLFTIPSVGGPCLIRLHLSKPLWSFAMCPEQSIWERTLLTRTQVISRPLRFWAQRHASSGGSDGVSRNNSIVASTLAIGHPPEDSKGQTFVLHRGR